MMFDVHPDFCKRKPLPDLLVEMENQKEELLLIVFTQSGVDR